MSTAGVTLTGAPEAIPGGVGGFLLLFLMGCCKIVGVRTKAKTRLSSGILPHLLGSHTGVHLAGAQKLKMCELMIPEKERPGNQDYDATLQRLGNGAYGDYHEWRLWVSDALRDTGYNADADEFLACSCDDATFWTTSPFQIGADTDAIRAYVCPDHGAKVVRKTCHLRICPDCARREANRLLARFMPKIQACLHAHNSNFRFRKIVLTTPYSLDSPDAKEQYARLKKAIPKVFDFLLGKNWRKKQGFLVADEWGADGLKLHFHILFYGQWISNKLRDGYPLSAAWRAITGGDCEVTYIAGVSAERVEMEVVETLKYCVKFWKTDPGTGDVCRLSPELMVVLHEMLKGQRRVRAYGIFYRLPVLDDLSPQCPDCGQELVRMTISQYNVFLVTGWLPSEQTLYLRTGNKSPPDTLVDGWEAPEPAKQIFAEPVQLPLSPDFLRSRHAMSYMQ